MRLRLDPALDGRNIFEVLVFRIISHNHFESLDIQQFFRITFYFQFY